MDRSAKFKGWCLADGMLRCDHGCPLGDDRVPGHRLSMLNSQRSLQSPCGNSTRSCLPHALVRPSVLWSCHPEPTIDQTMIEASALHLVVWSLMAMSHDPPWEEGEPAGKPLTSDRFAALAGLWIRAQPAIAAYVGANTSDFHTAEDIVQEVARVVAEKFGEYDSSKSSPVGLWGSPDSVFWVTTATAHAVVWSAHREKPIGRRRPAARADRSACAGAKRHRRTTGGAVRRRLRLLGHHPA